MIFDTDVLIWALSGNARAAAVIDAADTPMYSVVSRLELMHGARNKQEASQVRGLLVDFQEIPLTESTGQRAVACLEQFGLKTRLGPMDAIIAAAALERNLPLCTGNIKHFRQISDLELRPFRAK